MPGHRARARAQAKFIIIIIFYILDYMISTHIHTLLIGI